MEKPPKQENVFNNQEKIKFPDISLEIEKMAKEDQDIRSMDLRGNDEQESNLADRMLDIDETNTEKMKHIVEQIGWPTISRVGKESSVNAWLLVQHADHDVDFQKQCLDLMKAEPAGEVELHDIAYLEDRIRVNTNEGQVYGTQFRETLDPTARQKTVIAYGPKPIEDAEHVNERRASVGLEPMEEYTERLTRKYYPHLLDKKSEN